MQKQRIPFVPFGDRIVVQRVEAADTVGGIIIPDTAKDKQSLGKVLAMGEGVSDRLQFDMLVMFGKYAGAEFKLEGNEYLLLRQEEIFGAIASAALAQSFVEEGAFAG